MSAWLDEEPFHWWEGVWMVLGFPLVVVGNAFAHDYFWAMPLITAGVVGIALMVARLRQAARKCGIGR